MRKVVYLSILASLLVALPLTAQTEASLSGEVTDETTGEPLVGATIRLVGTLLGASTDMNGQFLLPIVPPGAYQVEISQIGYSTFTDTVRVALKEKARLVVALAPSPLHMGEILIHGERALSAASSRAVRQFDLHIRPNRTAHQMLQLMPGLIIAQHAGGGKAEQIFLRGFDADHGTDVAISVDGVPVNMVSHGHGQGYADMHFLIPEVVESLDVKKGPYFAEFGNLATAGAIAYHTRDRLDNNAIHLEGGGFNTAQYTMLYQIPLAGPEQSAYFAGKYYRTDGPVKQPQGLERLNVFGKYHTRLSDRSTLTLTTSGFSSAWDASGQIPQRAIEQGLIDRWGSIDDLEGGTTGRQDVQVNFHVQGTDAHAFDLQAYLVNYQFKLFSNFTFFLEDPERGDTIEQTDIRRVAGINSDYTFHHYWGPYLAHTTMGGGLRADNAAVGLWKSPDRQRLAPLVEADVVERNLFLWAQEEIVLTPHLQLVLGLRGDYFTFNVDDHLEGQLSELPHASGFAQASILSPKASLVYSPIHALDLFANFGTGFHSNDARNNVIDARAAQIRRAMRRDGRSEADVAAELAQRNIDPGHLEEGTLPRAVGAETGLRTRLFDRLSLGAALWWMDLESEFVFVGDAGTTEASGETRRVGLDLEARLQLSSWLWADADLNFSRGRAMDEPEGADEIPLAPTGTSTGGLTWRHPNGLEGSLRYRHIGDRPANEDGSVTATGYTVVDFSGAYQRGAWRFNLGVENALDTTWNEAQFDTESRLRDEKEPVSEIHFTPGNPLNMRLGVSLLF